MNLPDSLLLVTDTLWRIKEKDEFANVLEDILTPSEITELADRITILKMLQDGKSQRDIAEALGVSVTTVSRGNRVLQYESKSIHKYIYT
jgi:TrpR-related protein YerC/YecD